MQCSPLDGIDTQVQCSRLKFLIKMQGPELQIANRDQHLGLRGELRGVERPRPALRAKCTLPEADHLMRAKFNDKGDLAGSSSRCQKGEAPGNGPSGRREGVALTVVSE